MRMKPIPKNFKFPPEPKYDINWKIVSIDGWFESTSVKKAKRELAKIASSALVVWNVSEKGTGKVVAQGMIPRKD